MPTHWESSKRPLFIRTVLVNGSRHAILTQEDPLLQTAQINKARPFSPQSTDSNESDNPTEQQKAEQQDEYYRSKDGKRDPRDLEACLVKLRLVLAEKRQAAANWQPVSQPVDTRNKKRKRGGKSNNRKKSCAWHKQTPEDAVHNNAATSPGKLEYDSNHNITVAAYFSSETVYKQQQSLEDNYLDRIKGTCHSPFTLAEPAEEFNHPTTLNIIPDFDIPWNTISSENYFTRPFYNRLSERVLQWLDLASKRKDNPIASARNRKPENQSKQKRPTTSRSDTSRSRHSHRDRSEDNSDEVKSEEDVDTALSLECPKFSEELNRLHFLKSEIPTKYQAYTQLQESIAQSFTTIVSIRSGKYAKKFKKPPLSAKKAPDIRGKLVRQEKVEESSDEENAVEETSDEYKRSGFFNRGSIFGKSLDSRAVLSKQDIPDPHPTSHLPPQLQSRIPWLRDGSRGSFWPSERAIGKPQLHIFIPAVPDENNDECSEVDSLNSEPE